MERNDVIRLVISNARSICDLEFFFSCADMLDDIKENFGKEYDLVTQHDAFLTLVSVRGFNDVHIRLQNDTEANVGASERLPDVGMRLQGRPIRRGNLGSYRDEPDGLS